MRQIPIFSFALFFLSLIMSARVLADTTNATQNLTFSIPAVSVFSVSGDVAFGTFSIPAAGSDLGSIGRNNYLTYSVTNNAGSNSRKITGQLSAALPSGIGMAMGLVAPAGASSNGPLGVSSTSAITYVTNIGNGAFPNNNVLLSLGASVGSAAVGSGTITITFTLTAQ